MTTRLKSTGRDAPPLDPDSAHDRALAAARAVEETLRAPPVVRLRRRTSTAPRLRSCASSTTSRTRQELMTKLVEDKLYDPDVARRAIDHLQDKGVHSDVDYAEQWARYKWRTAQWAPWQILNLPAREGRRRSRLQRGSLASVRQPRRCARARKPRGRRRRREEGGGHRWRGGRQGRRARPSSASTMATLEGLPQTTRRRRLFAWLERRGHRARVARDIISTLEGEDERRRWEEEAEKEAARDDEMMS